jgi:hypothetical protein
VFNPAKMMRSSIPQLAPAGNPGAGAISIAAPPSTGIRFNRRSATNPTDAPSGEKNGAMPPSAPGSGVGSGCPSERF